MKRYLAILLFLVFVFTVIVPGTVYAYEKPTDAQLKEIKDKIDEGNKVKDEALKKVKELNEARAEKPRDQAKIDKIWDEGHELLKKLEKLRNEAIALADKYYKPDAANAKGEPKWNVDVKGEGVTSKDGTVKIGEKSFDDGPGWLGSTKLHEFTHADQAKSGTWKDDDKGSNMNECEAYDRELKNAEKSGLSKDKIDDLKKRRDNYYKGLADANKKKIDAGNYNPDAVPIADAVDTGKITLDLTGNGIAAGDIFTVTIKRRTPEPFNLEIPMGTPIIPGVAGVQTMMVGEDIIVWLGDPVTVCPITGYCLDPGLLPPPTPEQISGGQPAPEWEFMPRLSNSYDIQGGIIESGNRLFGDGKYHADMPPETQKQTVIQRSLWYEAEPEKYDKERLHQDITEQVKNTGGKQTPEQVDKLTDNLWSDINLTLKDSQKNRPPTLKIEPKF